MKYSGLIGIILIAMTLAGCGTTNTQGTTREGIGVKVQAQGGEYTNISVAELQMMLEDKDFPLINVHIPFEGDLPGTDLSIPFDQIEAHLSEIPADKDARIVLYCRSGSMSSNAAETLTGLGYTNIYNLAGGFNAWEDAGLPMEGR